MSMVGRKGTIITVFSTAYAVGKTLIAINMAAELAKKLVGVDVSKQQQTSQQTQSDGSSSKQTYRTTLTWEFQAPSTSPLSEVAPTLEDLQDFLRNTLVVYGVLPVIQTGRCYFCESDGTGDTESCQSADSC